MMKVYKMIAAAVAALCLTSCLESHLEELPTYDGNDIESVAGVIYRFYTGNVIDASGEEEIAQYVLNNTNTVDKEAAKVEVNVTIPSNLPADQRDKVSLSYKKGDRQGLGLIVNLSAAAVITPLNGAPVLGAPGDWSKANQYEVMAADGSKKIWTITMTLNK